MEILNSLTQTKVPQGNELIIMSIRGDLVCILLDVEPEEWTQIAIGEDRNKVLHAAILKALHGMLMESILHWNKLSKGIAS